MSKLNTELAKNVLKLQNIPDSHISSIIETSEKIFSKIPNIFNNTQSNVGLIVGKVQSGKTSVMISTAALAFENGHSLVIALLSDTELLLTQNFLRMSSTFSGETRVHVYQVSKHGDFSGVTLEDLKYLHKHGDKILVCALKNKTRLSEITNSFIGSGYEDDNVLIFDDEGDDISQNTSSSKDKFGVDNDGEFYEKKFSATNKAIKDLKHHFSRFGYISVTATPQSIVMLQSFQHLSPSFVVTTFPGKGYCGLSYFHDEHRNDLIKIINDDANVLNGDNGIPQGLKNAIAFFVAGCIYRTKKNGNTDFKHSMMIHASRYLVNHQIVYQKMKTYVNLIKGGICFNQKISLQFIEMIRNEMKSITDNEEFLSFENSDVVEAFESIKITSINGRSEVKDIGKIQQVLPFHIFIGGDLLDRGVTIAGLAVSYIVRESEVAQMDTLLQRARWFGYKADYIETCRVYMTENLDEQFREMVPADDYMWDLLVECSEENINPMDMNFEFYIDTDILIPTSARKSLFELAISGLKTSQKYVMMNKKFNDENIQIINTFKKLFSSQIEMAKYGPMEHGKLTLKGKYVLDLLKQFHFSEEEKVCNFGVFENVFKRLKFNDNSNVEVLFMNRPEGVEKRSTVKPETNEIIGLLQGHSPDREPNDPLYYKGDRYLVNELPMVQIHMVTLKNDIKIDGTRIMLEKGTVAPMIAWMFPESSYEKIVVKKIELSHK